PEGGLHVPRRSRRAPEASGARGRVDGVQRHRRADRAPRGRAPPTPRRARVAPPPHRGVRRRRRDSQEGRRAAPPRERQAERVGVVVELVTSFEVWGVAGREPPRTTTMTKNEFETTLAKLISAHQGRKHNEACVECVGCESCVRSTFCRGSKNLVGCHYCVDCERCNGSTHCRASRDLTTSNHCVACERCTQCSDL